MWAEKIIFYKHCGSHHMLKIRCSGERQNPVYKENVIAYDTRPVYPDRDVVTESMGLGYPEVIQSASQVGSSLSNPDVANTHANVTSAIDPTVSQPGKSPQDAWHRNLDQSPCHKIPDRIPPASEDTLPASWGETDCPGRSRLTDVTSIVSANNAGAPRDRSGDLGQTSPVGPPIHEAIRSSYPTPVSDEALDATAKVVEAKTRFRKEDIEPS